MTPPQTIKAFPRSAGSQSQIADMIAQRFGIPCVQQNIHHWRSGRGGVSEPFPAPKGRNRYETAECFAWFEKNVLPNRQQHETQMTDKEAMRATKTRIEEKKDKLLGIKIGKEENKLIDRGLAETTSGGSIKLLLGLYRNTDERDTPHLADQKLLELGASPEIRNGFKLWFLQRQQSVTTQREESAERAARELDVCPQTQPITI